MENKKFTVVMATYNRPEMLKKAILSVFRQTYKNFDIVVTNDCGEDVSELINSFDKTKIKYLTHETNKGLGAARNTGIKNTDSDYLVCLDDDDYLSPWHLEFLARYLNNENKIVYTDAIREVQEKINGVYIIRGKDIPYSIDYNSDLILVQNITPVLCVGFDRKIAEESGLFREDLMAYEDHSLWVEISRKNPMLHVPIPTCTFTWRVDGTTMSSSRNEFTTLLPELYKKFRKYAKNYDWVVNTQNQILQQRGLQAIF